MAAAAAAAAAAATGGSHPPSTTVAAAAAAAAALPSASDPPVPAVQRGVPEVGGQARGQPQGRKRPAVDDPYDQTYAEQLAAVRAAHRARFEAQRGPASSLASGSAAGASAAAAGPSAGGGKYAGESEAKEQCQAFNCLVKPRLDGLLRGEPHLATHRHGMFRAAMSRFGLDGQRAHVSRKSHDMSHEDLANPLCAEPRGRNMARGHAPMTDGTQEELQAHHEGSPAPLFAPHYSTASREAIASAERYVGALRTLPAPDRAVRSRVYATLMRLRDPAEWAPHQTVQAFDEQNPSLQLRVLLDDLCYDLRETLGLAGVFTLPGHLLDTSSWTLPRRLSASRASRPASRSSTSTARGGLSRGARCGSTSSGARAAGSSSGATAQSEGSGRARTCNPGTGSTGAAGGGRCSTGGITRRVRDGRLRTF